MEIQGDYHDDYDLLDQEEKDDLVKEFQVEKDSLVKVPRMTARGRIQEVSNTVRNIRQLVCFWPFAAPFAVL